MLEIARLLLDIKAVELNTEKPFIYTSGIRSPIYCDNRKVLSYPEKRDIIIEAFLKIIKEKNLYCDIVAGVATAGIAWAAVVADRLKKPLVYVRAKAKGHGKENMIEGKLEPGKKVLVIEDLISTGGSSIAACKAIIENKCKVIACLAIFNYNLEASVKNFTEVKISLYSISDFNTLAKVAVEVKYITNDQKKILLGWQKDPIGWGSK